MTAAIDEIISAWGGLSCDARIMIVIAILILILTLTRED